MKMKAFCKNLADQRKADACLITAYRLYLWPVWNCTSQVLGDGKILEQGTHEALLRNNRDGPYAQLVHRQITKEANEINADAPEPVAGARMRHAPRLLVPY